MPKWCTSCKTHWARHAKPWKEEKVRTSGPPALIDTRAYGCLRTFSGKEEDWATWSFVARSYLDLLSQKCRDLMLRGESVDTAASITLTGMNENARTHSWTLFNVLTQSVEGRALSATMNSEPGNGLQPWWWWMPMSRGLVDVTPAHWPQPSWTSELLEALETWEVLIRRYEEQSKETVNDPTRCAVVMKHAPAGIRLALRTASSSIDSNYAKLKRCVKDYLQTGLNYDQQGTSVPAKDAGGPTPMDVGAIQKGDSKGKSSKGKDKGGKGKKGKKGKEKGVTKASGKARRFDGYCSYCEKYGHKKADCRQKARDQQGAGKGKGSINVVEATGGASSSSTHPPSTRMRSTMEMRLRREQHGKWSLSHKVVMRSLRLDLGLIGVKRKGGLAELRWQRSRVEADRLHHVRHWFWWTCLYGRFCRLGCWEEQHREAECSVRWPVDTDWWEEDRAGHRGF